MNADEIIFDLLATSGDTCYFLTMASGINNPSIFRYSETNGPKYAVSKQISNRLRSILSQMKS